ncbi:IS21 family transposase [Roseibium aggregatum]|uniref:IS21 family transposase n=1 Tax=Roseibium aggregatum TaxID=187304 RepID=A0A926P3Q5_9HYPH|nr:IS21 family transposase [Roseibium aggregatum]MBD1549751.1 IS21 family transposase [Roseibium aggregatum]
MPRRKQPRRMTVQDIRTILRLTHEQGLSVREVGLRLKLSKTTVATYLFRAREAGLNCWPLPAGRDDDATLKEALFQRVGRPPQDLTEPDWPKMAAEMKRKGVTLVLLWEEYRAAHPDGYGYTWFCERYREFENRISPRYRNRHEAGAVMQTDYAGHTIPVIDPGTGAEHRAQIFVAVLGASNYTFAWASLSQKLPDWIEAQVRALKFFGGVPKAIVCDNLKAAVAKPLWFEPSLTKTFSDMATHYDTTVLPARPRKPRDKGKVEGAVLIVERWILARLRNRQFFSIEALNVAIEDLLDDLNARTMRRVGRSRRELFEEIECPALSPLPDTPFEYAEWKRAKVHPDYHIEVLHGFYSVPHRLIGRHVDVRLTHRMIEIFHNHERVAVHHRRGQRGGHTTIKEHMPKAHQRHGGMTPESLIGRAARTGYHAAALVERLMRDRPHPEQGYRSALGVLGLQRQFGADRLEAACERALTVGTVNYASVRSILITGLDRAPSPPDQITATPVHDNIRGPGYYQ